MIHILFIVLLVLLSVSFTLALLALKQTERIEGRILILDFLSLLGLSAILLFGWRYEVNYVLDIAIAFFLILFLGLVIFVPALSDSEEKK